MKLKKLLTGISLLSFRGNLEDEIKGISCSSKEVRPGWLFAALKGVKKDGFEFIPEAVSKGAVAFLSERPCPQEIKGNWIQVEDAREAIALCAANFYGHPSTEMFVIGITGTNGKTTITYLVEEILKQARKRPGVIGTISYRTPEKEVSAGLTTPEAPLLQNILREMADQGLSHCLMEVSSHALDLKRVWGIKFDVVVFTNLSGEHLDYHHSLESYFEAKKKLFFLDHSKRMAVINIDDAWGRKLIDELGSGYLTYGLDEASTIRCTRHSLSESGIEMEVTYPGGKMAISSPLIGRPNLYNLLASIAVSLTLKISPLSIKAGLARCRKIPGRFERVENSLGLNIYVDYAHTDDALRHLLSTFHQLACGRIIAIFGAGGDRDKKKRKRMGEAAAEYADWIFLTSDNPRSEDPLAIISEIEKGVKERGNTNYRIIPDRRQALEEALSFARKGDYIIVAGKGHENYQILKEKTVPFNDKEILLEILKRMES
ncbi:MAG: UDP-N-acetylmuramoyl-L-alanyl-D-glutamate--2,6-diaminopimelate ligase [Candidatus Aminicenantales bacterium]